MSATDTKRKLAEKHAELAATPDRGFDSARRRAEIREDIDGLLELLLDEIDH